MVCCVCGVRFVFKVLKTCSAGSCPFIPPSQRSEDNDPVILLLGGGTSSSFSLSVIIVKVSIQIWQWVIIVSEIALCAVPACFAFSDEGTAWYYRNSRRLSLRMMQSEEEHRMVTKMS